MSNLKLRKEVLKVADTDKAEGAEKDTQPAAMPTADQKTVEKPEAGAGAQPPQGEEPKPAPQDSAKKQIPEDELPEGTKARTRKEFDKLKDQFREERTRRIKAEKAFTSMKPAEPVVDQYVDPTTGVVDVAGLNKSISDTKQRAVRAEKTVQSYIQEQQSQEAFKAYPELDSDNDNFDEDLHRRTRAFLTASMVYPQDYGDRTLTYKEAADMAKAGTTKAVEKAQEEGGKKAIEKLTPKEQASLEATGRSDRRKGGNQEDLSKRTRTGGQAGVEAAMERLKSIPLGDRG